MMIREGKLDLKKKGKGYVKMERTGIRKFKIKLLGELRMESMEEGDERIKNSTVMECMHIGINPSTNTRRGKVSTGICKGDFHLYS